jgi:hypothetical protein
MQNNIDLPGDSGDYHLLTKGIELSAHVPGLTCEIGLRRGGGTKHIIDAIAQYCPGKPHIAIDPYGNIEYENKEGSFVRLDYTNDMRDECLANLYQYTRSKQVPFIFFNLEDVEFFARYRNGVPVYHTAKEIVKNYSFVHFDGPHAYLPLLREIDFFEDRILPGTCWCFDDVTGYYDHDLVEKKLFGLNFKLIQKTWHKALYQYEGESNNGSY